MEPLPLLDQIIVDLLQDADFRRTKKLVVYACKQVWENDPSQLDAYDLRQLLQELRQRYGSLDELRNTLAELVKQINKKAEYTLIANGLLDRLRGLYGPPAPPERRPALSEVAHNYHPFDLRLLVHQQTSPLRAKLVLYTALYGARESTLALLKGHTLDQLLRALFEACPGPTELEIRLEGALHRLEKDPQVPGSLDQNKQTAQVLLQALRPLYAFQPPSRQPPMPAPPSRQPKRDPTPSTTLLFDQDPQQQRQERFAAMIAQIEQNLKRLSMELDERLQQLVAPIAIPLKYQLLHSWLRDIQASALQTLAPPEQEENSDPYVHLRQALADTSPLKQDPTLGQDLKRLMQRSIDATNLQIEQALITILSSGSDPAAFRPLASQLGLLTSRFHPYLAGKEQAERRLFEL